MRVLAGFVRLVLWFAAFVATAIGGWIVLGLLGFVDPAFNDYTEARCLAARAWTQATRGEEAPREEARFTILVSPLAGDDKAHTQTSHVIRSFEKPGGGYIAGFQVIELCRSLKIGAGDDHNKLRARAEARGRRWLAQYEGDLLIWGRALNGEPPRLELFFLAADSGGGGDVFALSSGLILRSDFDEHLRAIVLAMAVAQGAKAANEGGRFIAGDLVEPAEKLGALLEDPPRQLDREVLASLSFAYGNIASTLGLQTGNAAWLEKAIKAYRAALTEWTRERAPLKWAGTQNNLGAALRALGAMQGNDKLLAEAVKADREALKVYSREHTPLDWAGTQQNLGNALQELGRLRKDGTLLEQAVAAHREALKVLTRERVPLQWAATQNNLGGTLWLLGRLRKDEGLLREAVTAYREALKEFTREREPIHWAGVQNNLGVALSDLGRVRQSEALLREAVTAFREALKEWTRERVPRRWAMAQRNLGVALSALGYLRKDEALVRQSIAAHREALREYTRERAPLEWAATQENLGVSQLTLALLRKDKELLREAIVTLESARDSFRELGLSQRAEALDGLVTKLRQGLEKLEEEEAAGRTSALDESVNRIGASLARREYRFGPEFLTDTD